MFLHADRCFQPASDIGDYDYEGVTVKPCPGALRNSRDQSSLRCRCGCSQNQRALMPPATSIDDCVGWHGTGQLALPQWLAPRIGQAAPNLATGNDVAVPNLRSERLGQLV